MSLGEDVEGVQGAEGVEGLEGGEEEDAEAFGYCGLWGWDLVGYLF